MTNTSIYQHWFKKHGQSPVLLPNMVLVESSPGGTQIVRGGIRGILPNLRLYWNQWTADKAEFVQPPWMPETWTSVDSVEGGFVRFFRADQVLDLLSSVHSAAEDAKAFKKQVRHCLNAWFVPIDAPVIDRPEIHSHRVESIRMFMRGDRHQRQWIVWSRSVERFPNAIREHLVEGLDPVHTPENARAGLTRYLCDEWTINDDGRLAVGERATTWGPSTGSIPYRAHDAPRRLMLGASLQSRATQLVESELPQSRGDVSGWHAPGRNLRAAFSIFGGWTHEDAIVLSNSASHKLTHVIVEHVDLLIPSIANRVELTEPGPLKRGAVLARAFVDLYAMGYRKNIAEDDGAIDGWIEIGIPGAELLSDTILQNISREKMPASSRWRELIRFRFERRQPVGVGDKLATRHGIKGVVSRILRDDEMPKANGERAEIILSPQGLVRRGALGQFRESCADEDAPDLPRSGMIFVMRQPQDAGHPHRYRVLGGKSKGGKVKGQRYGEMEFWALMAHGANVVAHELLSLARSTARWMDVEAHDGITNYRKISTRALNRYFAIVGARIKGGNLLSTRDERNQIVVKRCDTAFEIDIPKVGTFYQSLDQLNDEMLFRMAGGLGVIVLKDPVPVAFRINEDHEITITFKAIHVIPPWLRPKVNGADHKLTAVYKKILKCLAWLDRDENRQKLPSLIRTCVRIAMGDRVGGEKMPGVDVFLRREVLGRRLTRSARAVIVPDPELRIDQIRIPKDVAEVIFDGLGERQRSIVLVNRNPTLQRRGLLAMRPVIDESHDPVFRLPLGVLKTLAADFDGDQASIVALESEAAIEQAEKLLLPGSVGLRSDPFRPGEPAFPLAKEMSCSNVERELAVNLDSNQDTWSANHAKLVRQRINELGDGWVTPLSDPIDLLSEEILQLWNGIDVDSWLARAGQEMGTVYASVRKKGRYGGVLRRQLYRRRFTETESFRHSVEALHAITEPLIQSALSCKSGRGAFSFPVDKFFENPVALRSALKNIDPQKNSAGETIGSCYDEEETCKALGASVEPTGLLAWFANPTFQKLLRLIADSDPAGETVESDPRLSWYIE